MGVEAVGNSSRRVDRAGLSRLGHKNWGYHLAT